MKPHLGDERLKTWPILSFSRIFGPQWLDHQSAPRSKTVLRVGSIVAVILVVISIALHASPVKAETLTLRRDREQTSLFVLQHSILNRAGTRLDHCSAVRLVMTGSLAAQPLFLAGAVFGPLSVIRGLLLRMRPRDPSRFLDFLLVLGGLEFVVIACLLVERIKKARFLRALRRSEESYRRLVELAPDAMLVHRCGKIIFANKACVALLGAADANELLGKQTVEFVPPDERTVFEQGITAFSDDSRRVRQKETFFVRLDGKVIYVHLMACAVSFGGETAFQLTLRDITERKQAEQKLKESEERLAVAQRVAHIGSWEWDLSQVAEYEYASLHWSDETFRIFGYEPGQIADSGEAFLRAVHPEDRPRLHQSRAVAIREKKPYRVEYRIILPDGSQRIVAAQADVISDDDRGGPARFVGTIQDITERKKAEERFQKAFNANPEPITIATIEEGRFVDVNESFLQVTGYRREEVIGHTSLDLNFWDPPEDRTKLVDLLKRKGAVRDLEISFQTKLGERRSGLSSAEVIEIGGHECVLAITKDVTERRALEEQLRQSQKMEAIGRLSGGIAHDFNNVLGVIIGYGETLEEVLEPGSSLGKNASEITKAGRRAAALTRQLLAFSRQQMLEPKVLNLNSVLSDVEKLLRRLIGEDIDLATELAPDLAHVKADQGQIEQILMNLAVNARDAMPEGGKLIIRTSNVFINEPFVALHPPTTPGQYVLLSVTDTGEGMDRDVQAHIFDPFFTTKGRDKGTGLGLSVVYGVVKQSGGYIWVSSEPGKGSTFDIYLPSVKTAVETTDEMICPGKADQASETILLVEDDDSLRHLIHHFLEKDGYNVLEACKANSAQEIARQQERIDMLLTDVVLPEMNGRLLADKIEVVHPRIKVLFMSGYTDHVIGAHGVLETGTFFLQKPFTRQALTDKVREVIAAQKTDLNPA